MATQERTATGGIAEIGAGVGGCGSNREITTPLGFRGEVVAERPRIAFGTKLPGDTGISTRNIG